MMKENQKKNLLRPEDEARMPMTRKGILLLAAGFAVMVLGYILMIGGGSDDPARFNYAMFDFQRTVLSPVVILAGVALIVVGILRKSK